ncbi:Sec-independent protein translocase subunit TatA [Nocardioides sp. cx-169]|uniref:Sec-independent protein translocase subunit TatA n=1 Tax=Nocardioides sp. cx-169 TaxID=2899080 RepID=UPI001E34A8E6|nr:Sec-independent protein translocase subunit TatA [Nocardioides sp. cx-169]MCD4535329.1 Sec-independent protein translocase subunit TatA [Nocardioides sp. cx-169]
MSYPLIGMPAGAEWLIILAIVILVFGAAKLPALARSTGQSLRIFKAETKGLREDDAQDPTTPPVTPSAELPPVPPPAGPQVSQPQPPSTEQSDTRNV